MTFLTILYFIIGLSILVLLHEFGHYIFAKIFGVYVYEFSLFMGPKLFQFKVGETKYSLRLLPIGGYCAMAGEDDFANGAPIDKDIETTEEMVEESVVNNVEVEEIKENIKARQKEEEIPNVPFERTLQGISKWKKIIILAAGGLTNIILCFFLMLAFFVSNKKPKVNLDTSSTIYEELKVDSIEIAAMSYSFYEDEWKEEFNEGEDHFQGTCVYTNAYEQDQIQGCIDGGNEYIYERFLDNYDNSKNLSEINFFGELVFKDIEGNKYTYNFPIVLEFNEAKDGFANLPSLSSLGLSLANENYSFGQSIAKSFKMQGEMAVMIYKAIPKLFTKEGSKNVTGIVGMYSVAKTYMAGGFSSFLFFLAMISVNLGIMNLLPFPALDGGQIVLTIVEMITKKETPKKLASILNLIGFGLLILLMIVVTIKDIVSPII